MGNSQEKTNSTIPCEQFYTTATQLDSSKTTKQFSVNSRRKFLCQYQRRWQAEVNKHLVSSFPFSDFYILSSLLGCYFSGTSCTFHFGQKFNGFLTSTFDFY